MNLLNLQEYKEEMILIMKCSLEHLLILCNSEYKIKHNLYLWNGKQLDYYKKKIMTALLLLVPYCQVRMVLNSCIIKI